MIYAKITHAKTMELVEHFIMDSIVDVLLVQLALIGINLAENIYLIESWTELKIKLKIFSLPGLTGPLCDTFINTCQPNPCLNGGNCTGNSTSYSCQCSQGKNK